MADLRYFANGGRETHRHGSTSKEKAHSKDLTKIILMEELFRGVDRGKGRAEGQGNQPRWY